MRPIKEIMKIKDNQKINRKHVFNFTAISLLLGLVLFFYYYFKYKPEELMHFDKLENIKSAKISKNIKFTSKFSLLKEINDKALLNELNILIRDRDRFGDNKRWLEYYLINIELENGKEVELLFQVELDFSSVYCTDFRYSTETYNIMMPPMVYTKFSSDSIGFWIKKALNN